MKVVIIGGHFTPALAVIEALDKKSDIVYFGRKYTFENDKTLSLEYQTITKRNIPFVSITTGRLQRKFSAKTLSSLAKIPFGFFQAVSLLKRDTPDIIVGFGGYVSVPICLAGKMLGIPIVIHEQTLEAGLANKFIAQFATNICISWPSSRNFFPKQKTILTGNPLPKSMFDEKVKKHPPGTSDASVPSLCIIGGSAGSHAINVLIESSLSQLLERYTIVHQTGDAQEFHDYDRLARIKVTLPEKLQKRYTIVKYIDPEQFIHVLQAADLVVSRCGINTITALLWLQKKCLLIPLPFSQRQEQYKNALLVKTAGFGEIADQETLTAKILFDKIAYIFNNKKTYEKNAAQIEKTDPFSATQKIITVITDLYQKNTKTKT